MSKAKLNYWVDLIIGIGFFFSSLSGIVFLLPGEPTSGIVGVSYKVWNDLHTVSSLLMIAGVGLHLLLHWRWIVNMTRRMVRPGGERVPRTVTNHVSAHDPLPQKSSTRGVSRRRFLRLSAGALTGICSLALGYRVICSTGPSEPEERATEGSAPASSGQERTQVESDDQADSDAIVPSETTSDEADRAPARQEAGVACPFGLVYDPHPGRCRRYRDSNGDEYCDYSIPGSGTNRART